MGTIERKERERLEMRKVILMATMEMILTEGFDKTSIRAIAEKIEYSVGTIYIYFRDKNEVLNALMEQGFEKLTGLFSKITLESDPVANLRKLADTYVKFGLTNPEYYDLMFIMRKPPEYEGQETFISGSKAFGTLYQCVDECLKQEKIKMKGTEISALTIWGFLHGLVALQVMNRLKIFDQKLIRQKIQNSVKNFINAIEVEDS